MGTELQEAGDAFGADWSPPGSVQIPASMTAEELALEILDRRNVSTREKDYWTCFEVNEKEEAGEWRWRALSPAFIHPALCSWGAGGFG